MPPWDFGSWRFLAHLPWDKEFNSRGGNCTAAGSTCSRADEIAAISRGMWRAFSPSAPCAQPCGPAVLRLVSGGWGTALASSRACFLGLSDACISCFFGRRDVCISCFFGRRQGLGCRLLVVDTRRD